MMVIFILFGIQTAACVAGSVAVKITVYIYVQISVLNLVSSFL